jgi:enoyl-[acyl-carrier protein] reductase I
MRVVQSRTGASSVGVGSAGRFVETVSTPGRLHAVSPGPIKTRASGGLKDFDLLLNEAAQRAPVGELVDIDDVGAATAYLATPYARRLTGSTLYVDAGLNIMA